MYFVRRVQASTQAHGGLMGKLFLHGQHGKSSNHRSVNSAAGGRLVSVPARIRDLMQIGHESFEPTVGLNAGNN